MGLAWVVAVAVCVAYTPVSVGLHTSSGPSRPAINGSSRNLRSSGLMSAMLATSDLSRKAIVTMAATDDSARNAVALFQSLRDVGTQVPNLIAMLVQPTTGSQYCKMNAESVLLQGETSCGSSRSPLAVASPAYLRAFHRLGVQVRVVDAFKETKYNKQVAGGLNTFWGVALSKLKVWGFYEFDKVLWMDSDIIVQRNIDHLLLTDDELICALTGNACNENEGGKVGGGTWSLKPSKERIKFFEDMMHKPLPQKEEWRQGDMAVIRSVYTKTWHEGDPTDYWPYTADQDHGYIPNVQYVDPDYAKGQRKDPRKGAPAAIPKGYLPEKELERRQKGMPLIHFLDPRYDQIAYMCVCNSKWLGLSRASAVEAGFAEPWRAVATPREERILRSAPEHSRARRKVEFDLLARLRMRWPAPLNASKKEREARPPSAAYDEWYGPPMHPPGFDYDKKEAIPGYLRAIGCDPALPVPCGKGRPVDKPLPPLRRFYELAAERRAKRTGQGKGNVQKHSTGEGNGTEAGAESHEGAGKDNGTEAGAESREGAGKDNGTEAGAESHEGAGKDKELVAEADAGAQSRGLLTLPSKNAKQQLRPLTRHIHGTWPEQPPVEVVKSFWNGTWRAVAAGSSRQLTGEKSEQESKDAAGDEQIEKENQSKGNATVGGSGNGSSKSTGHFRPLTAEEKELLYGSQLMVRIPYEPHANDSEARKAWRPREGPTGYDDGVFTMHFTSMGKKPAGLDSQEDHKLGMEERVGDKACLREPVALWYSKFYRGMGGEEARRAGDPDAEAARLPTRTTMAGPVIVHE